MLPDGSSAGGIEILLPRLAKPCLEPWQPGGLSVRRVRQPIVQRVSKRRFAWMLVTHQGRHGWRVTLLSSRTEQHAFSVPSRESIRA